MQQHVACAFFCFLALASIAEGLASSTSAAAAKEWLQDHPAVQADELAELKAQNPEAYAIVKALLTKRSLGLLDPKHPTASFSAPPPASAQETVPSGAAAFAKFASPSASSTSKSTQSLMYPDAPAAPASRDWFSWKPQDSAVNDEAMVQSVLGAVAELKGHGASSKSLLSKRENTAGSTSSSTLQAHDGDFETELPATSPVASTVQSVHESDGVSTTDENSYLKGFDLGLKPAADVSETVAAPSKRSNAAIQGNSYLRGINLESVEQPALVNPHDEASAPEKSNYLSSFSWGDDSESKPATSVAPARLVQQQQAVDKHASSANALTAWLDGGAKKQAATAQTLAVPDAKQGNPEASSNPYTSGLW